MKSRRPKAIRSRRKLRVVVLTHSELVPPTDTQAMSAAERHSMQTELDVVDALTSLGHAVRVLGIHYELFPIRELVDEFKPHVVVNLLEEFRDSAMLDYNVVAFLEALGVPYTGCNPRGLIVGRDKALSKLVVSHHRIRAPRFAVFRKRQRVIRPRRLEFPLIVKSLTADASEGISEASVVRTDEKLTERVQFIHRTVGTSAIVEQFIEGRELYATVLGHQRLTTLPPWELCLENLRPNAPRIATRRVKWDKEFQTKHDLYVVPAEVDDDLLGAIDRTSKRVYRALRLSGYARVDYRLTDDGKLYFLEANPNPDIQRESETAGGAYSAGMEAYPEFIQRLLQLGLRSLV